MLFIELVAAVGAVRRRESRNDQVTLLRELFEHRSPTEVAAAIELLLRTHLPASPDPAVQGYDAAPRTMASLTCERAAESLGRIDRAPAAAFRRNLIREFLSEATSDEWPLLTELIDPQPFDRPTFDLIVSAVAKSARVPIGNLRRAASVSGSLSLAGRIALERGVAGVHAVGLEPGRPIPPTLVERRATTDVLLESPHSVIVEWHPPDARIQAHRLRGVVTIYDDALNDVTDRLAAVVEQIAELGRGDLVLDGWVDAVHQPSAESTSTSGLTRRSAPSRQGRASFFDILFDGASLVDEPLKSRRELLATVVPQQELAPIVPVGSLDEIASALNESVRRGYCGLIVKPLDAPYEGGFVRSSWRSIEPKPAAKLAVTAATYGSGKRSHLLSIVHLSARDDRDQDRDGDHHDVQHDDHHDDDHHSGLVEVGRASIGADEETVVRRAGDLADLALDNAAASAGRAVRLRPEIVAVVTIQGLHQTAEQPGWAVHRPRVIGYCSRDEVSVTAISELVELAHGEISPQVGQQGTPVVADDQVAPREQPPLPYLPTSVPTLPHPDVWRSSTPPTGLEGLVASTERTATERARPRRRSIGDVEFEPYVEPSLPTARRWHRGVVVARVLALAWFAVLLTAALVVRSRDGSVDGAVLDGAFVDRVGLVGLLVIVALAITGWGWTDQLVRTLTLLDGRRPTRPRCVSAWLTPVVGFLLLALLVVPLEPTTPADIRPALLAAVFGLVMWRPYALLRRIMRTLTRVSADSLIGVAYLLDFATFGLLWWRMTQWADRGQDIAQGEVDILVGTLGAVAIAGVANVGIWTGLIRVTDTAVGFRKSSQRTRYEHRMLRLRGVDPTDAEVWWELCRGRADEQRALTAETATVLPSVDDLVARTRDENRIAFRRLGEHESIRLEERLRAEFSAIIGEHSAHAAGEPGSNGTAPLDDGPSAETLPETRSDDRRDREGATERDEDPIEAMRRQARQDAEPEPERTEIEELISRAGALEIDDAISKHRKREQARDPGVRLVPPRLASVESTRLLMVLAFGALTLVSAWLVVISLGSDGAAGAAELPSSVVDDLELARKLFWALFTTATALLPVWALTVIRQARRTGLSGLRIRRLVALSSVSGVALVAAFVLDAGDRSMITTMLAIPIVWSAMSAGLSVESVRGWFELPGSTLTAWIGTLPVILGVAWLAGLSSQISPTASIQGLAFTTILLTLGCARVTVMAVLSSVDIENELRASPELAVPVGRPRHTAVPAPAAANDQTDFSDQS